MKEEDMVQFVLETRLPYDLWWILYTYYTPWYLEMIQGIGSEECGER
jgi:hypothetical protein